MNSLPLAHSATQRLAAWFALTKPRVNSLIVFCAVIGMFLASPDLRVPLPILLAATVGIALVAGAAAAVNCLFEERLDGIMARTQARPLPTGQINPFEAFFFSGLLGAIGLSLLYHLVNELTMWLTLATFVFYAVVYTLLLKPRTPQNIVIGGAAGAMPPLLGWAAVSGGVNAQALALFLIIFLWTPPHFWSLACARRQDYERAGLPMMPVVKGVPHTCRLILLYVLLLSLASLLPVCLGMSGGVYLISAVLLDVGFIAYAIRLNRRYSDALAKKCFAYSLLYLSLLFAALFADRLWQ